MTNRVRATVDISDPWEFKTLTDKDFVTGIVDALTEAAVTVRLDSEMNINGGSMTVAEVTPRHVGHALKSPCTATPVNITFWADDHAAWYAAIGTLTLE